MKSDNKIRQERDRMKINLSIAIKSKNKSTETNIRGYLTALRWVLEND